jgi:hypothetical protein
MRRIAPFGICQAVSELENLNGRLAPAVTIDPTGGGPWIGSASRLAATLFTWT